jgi:hypothetical protein
MRRRETVYGGDVRRPPVEDRLAKAIGIGFGDPGEILVRQLAKGASDFRVGHCDLQLREATT